LLLLFNILYFLDVTSNQDVLSENEGYLHPSTENPELDSMQGNAREQVPIRTRDLICWSFQIASGMNHLANKKAFLNIPYYYYYYYYKEFKLIKVDTMRFDQL